MKLVEYSVQLPINKSAAWARMVDWKNWTEWDCEMEAVEFPHELRAGASGKLKLKGAPEVPLTVTFFQSGEEYTSEFPLAGSRMIFDHKLKSLDSNSTVMTFTVDLKGLSSTFLSMLVSSKVQRTVKQSMANFLEQTMQQNKPSSKI